MKKSSSYHLIAPVLLTLLFFTFLIRYSPASGTDEAYADFLAALKSGDWQRAESSFIQAVSLDPNLPYKIYRRELTAEEKEIFKKAVSQLVELIKKDGTNGNLYAVLGGLELALRDFAMAATHLEIAVKLRQKDVYSRLLYGIALKESGNPDKARKVFEDARALGPENPNVLFYTGWLAFESSEYEVALKTFDEALARNPDDINAYFLKGLIKFYEKKDMAGASEEFMRVLARAPEHRDAQFLFALAERNRGNRDSAKAAFARAALLDPSNRDASFLAAISYFEDREYEVALEKFRKTLALDPSNRDANLLAGISAFYTHDYEVALNFLDNAIKVAPADPKTAGTAYFLKGLIKYDGKNYREALNAFEKARELQPLNGDAHFLYGYTAYLSRDYSKAIEGLTQASRLRPDDTNASFLLGLASYEAGKKQEARKFFEKTLSIKPDNRDATFLLGLSAYDEKDYEVALRNFERTIILDPYNSDAHFLYGISAMGLGRYEVALVALGRAAELGPGPRKKFTGSQASYLQGVSAFLAHNYEVSIKAFERALTSEPGNATAQFLLGLSNFERKDYARALEDFKKATKLAPADADSHLLLGVSAYYAGDNEGALQALSKALQLRPGETRASLLKGAILVKEKKFNEAAGELAKVLLSEPENPLANFLAGYAKMEMGDSKGARSNFEKTLLKQPDNAEANLLLATVLMREKNYDAAMPLIERAARNKPSLSEGFLIKGALLNETKRYKEAVESLQKLYDTGYRSEGLYSSLIHSLIQIKDMEKARKYIEEGLKTYPGSLSLKRLHADFLSQEGNMTALKKVAEELVKAEPGKADGYVARGNVYLAARDFAKAKNEFKKALELAPEDPRVMLPLAFVELELREDQAAMARFNKILSLEPDNAEAYFGRGCIKARNNALLDARADLEMAVNLKPSHWHAQRELGRVCRELGDYRSAIRALETAYSYNQNDDFLLSDLANAYSLVRQHPKAIPLFRKLHEKYPDDPRYIASLANSLVLDYAPFDQAIGIVKKAAELNKNNPDVIGMLAVLYLDNGKYDEGIAVYDEALKRFPDNAGLLAGKAHILYAKKEYDKAMELAERAFSLAPENPRIPELIASLKIDTGKLQEAENVLREAVQKHPAEIRLLTRFAEVLFMSKKFRESLEKYMILSGMIGPEGPVASEYRFFMGECFRNLGDIENAKKQYNEAISADSGCPWATKARQELEKLR